MNYCLNYPFCPVCHEPHNSSFVEKISPQNTNFEENTVIYKCFNCGTYFKSSIDLTKFPNTQELLNQDTAPILWDINLNHIEESYVNWLKPDVFGKFLITWPWKNVEFLPILISDYALNYPERKIIVIEDININDDLNKFYKPDIKTILDNLYFYDLKNNDLNSNIKKEEKKFSKKLNIKKVRKVQCHIKLLTDNSDVNQDFSIDPNSFNSKIKPLTIKNLIEESYGKKTVRNINWPVHTSGGKYRPKNPLFDVNVFCQEEWGGKPKFPALNYWKILNNYETLTQIKSKINFINIIDDISDEEINQNQIFFIDSYSDELFNIINKINPDLIIFKNSDMFINKPSFINVDYRFVNFLNLTDKNVLLFSTDKNSRHIYEELIQEGELDLNNLTFHTWDSIEVLKDIKNSKNTNILSSSFSELEDYHSPKIDYIPVSELSNIEVFLPKLYSKMESLGISQDLKFFFNRLISTPIQIADKGNQFNFSYYDNTLKSLLEDLSEQYEEKYDEDIYAKILKPFREIYLKDYQPYNPLIESVLNEVNKFLTKKNNFIVVVSPTSFYRKTIKHILYNQIDEESQWRVSVETWNSLEKITLMDNEVLQIIATTCPFMSFNLSNNKFKNFTFIGAPNYIKNIENMISNRVLEKEIMPIKILNTNNQAPKLLKENLSSLSNYVTEVTPLIDEIISTKKFDYPTINNNVKTNYLDSHVSYHRKLDVDDEVVLIINEENQGIFIPLNQSITYKNNAEYSMSNFLVKSKNLDELIGKEIIIDNQGFYRSYKEFFTKFMVDNTENIKISTMFGSFNGFKDLIQTAYSWLDLFREIVFKKNDSSIGNSLNHSKYVIASKLNRLGAPVKSIYIKNVWLADPLEIKTNHGIIKTYEIEHPQKIQTLIDLYANLSEEYDFVNLSSDDAFKTFTAAKFLQKIRQNFIKNKNIPLEYKQLHEIFNKEIRSILANSELFEVQNVKKVKLSDAVTPYKKYEDYIKFC